MADDLSDIDTSHLDGLSKLEADQKALRALCDKAAWHREKVVEVWTRVSRDYEARIRGLDEKANELRQKAREDLHKLDDLFARGQQAVDQARVDLQESEFRHEIGEFSDEEFKKKQQESERTITDRQAEFERLGKLRARYLEVLPAEPAPAPPPPPAAAAPAPPKRAVAGKASEPAAAPTPAESGATMFVGPAAASAAARGGPAPAAPPPTPAIPPAYVPPADGATSFMAPPSTSDFRVPPARGAAPPAAAASDAEPFGTIAISPAMLVEDRDGLPGAHHALGRQTTIGRTNDNQIVVPVREVSRRHAEIVLTETGYLLKDLGSPNGTYVNGQRVTEHRLEDGDRIGVAGNVFVFKAR